MPETPKVCFFCQYWVADPTALDKKLEIAANFRRFGKEVPMMYGKCKASFVGKDNQPETIDKGTLASHDCDVLDHDGYQVFKLVPED